MNTLPTSVSDFSVIMRSGLEHGGQSKVFSRQLFVSLDSSTTLSMSAQTVTVTVVPHGQLNGPAVPVWLSPAASVPTESVSVIVPSVMLVVLTPAPTLSWFFTV